MKTPIVFARPAALALAAALAGCGGGSGASAALNCEAINTAALGIAGLKVTSSTRMPAKTDGATAAENHPAHCRVQGSLNERTGIDGKPYAVGFEVRLPESWNGKFFFQGGSGTNGVLVPALGDLLNTSDSNALSNGYAVASTDGGHNTGQADATFGLDPQARVDYGYNAVGTTTQAAKQIIAKRYGRAPDRSYLVGCSNGGRDAMVAATRFADQFDGMVAANPGFNLPKAAIAQQWDTQQFMAAGGGKLPKEAFPQSVMDVVSNRILAKCDALDGASDGMVNNRSACQGAFNLDTDVPTCTGAPDGSCVTAAQKTALKNVFAGAKNGAGQALYASWPWDPGVAGANWRFWKLDAGFAPLPFNTLIGAGAMGYIFTSPPDAPNLAADAGLGYQLAFNMDTDAPKIFARNSVFTPSAMEFMTPVNATQLSALKNRGGKLIVYHGTADPVFSPNDSIAWYDAVSAGDSAAASYARLFLVPGMNHCSGGPATDRFNMLTALENWVERGVAPDSVVAKVNPADPDVKAKGWPATRTRPLCAYPKQAVLKAGATDLESAGSFVCQ